ncbi:hypothetical protein SDC9_58607 [bioreactor metagenome]|uniref:Uncharacterized protein n=1 Tax=bioreactor metagenome TaxID=1076179 RepID=A0A644X7W0_9ZZZZ
MIRTRSEKAEKRKTPLKVLKIRNEKTLKNTRTNVVVIPSALTCVVSPSKPKRKKYMVRVENNIMKMSIIRIDMRDKTLLDK